jgi:hypothetical protein
MHEVMTEMEACTTKDQAKALVDKQVTYILAEVPAMTTMGAREVALQNIGYLTGYYSREEAARLLDLFETKHPIFGAIKDWPTNPDDILRLGIKMAHEGMRRRNDDKG